MASTEGLAPDDSAGVAVVCDDELYTRKKAGKLANLETLLGDDPLPRGERAFAEQVKRARTRLPAVAEGAFRLLGAIAAEHIALTQRINALPPALTRLGTEVRARRWLVPGKLRLEVVGAWLAKGGFLRRAPGAPDNGDTHYLLTEASYSF